MEEQTEEHDLLCLVKLIKLYKATKYMMSKPKKRSKYFKIKYKWNNLLKER